MMSDTSEGTPILDLNTSPVEALSELPGVGPALAERIVAARPFEDVDDLRRVRGLGATTIDGLKERVRVQPPTPVPESGAAQKPSAPPAGRAPSTYSKGQVAALLGLSCLISILLSVSLTLAALLGINGTLDVGRSRSVTDLQAQTGQLQGQIQVLQGQLNAVDQRVQSLQGLTGRMSQVETQANRLASEVQAAQTETQRLGTQVDSLSASLSDLERRQAQQEAVFQGLADLLAPWAGLSTSTPAPIPTPSPTPALGD
jgi:prefoldin subunit 5